MLRREATPGDTSDTSDDGEGFLDDKLKLPMTPNLGAHRKRGKRGIQRVRERDRERERERERDLNLFKRGVPCIRGAFADFLEFLFIKCFILVLPPPSPLEKYP